MSKKERHDNRGQEPGAYLLWIPTRADSDSRHLGHLITAVIQYKSYLIIALVAGLVSGFAISFALKPWYQAETLVLPAQDQSAGSRLSGAIGQLGALASITGVDLGAANAQREEILAVLESRSFASQFIGHMAIAEALARGRQELLVDDTQQTDAGTAITFELVDEFLDDVLVIREVEGTALVRVIIRWPDRVVAAVWAREIVNLLNEVLRKRSIDEASKQIALLSERLGETSNLEIQGSIYRLMEAQLQRIVIAGARDDFALRKIDPAVVPPADQFYWPNRILFAAAGAFLGLALILVFVFIRYTRKAVGRKSNSDS